VSWEWVRQIDFRAFDKVRTAVRNRVAAIEVLQAQAVGSVLRFSMRIRFKLVAYLFVFGASVAERT
jgi:hypothetical protein